MPHPYTAVSRLLESLPPGHTTTTPMFEHHFAPSTTPSAKTTPRFLQALHDAGRSWPMRCAPDVHEYHLDIFVAGMLK